MGSEPIHHLFVYGTLRQGDARWPLLEPFVVDHGWDDTVPGRVYDTGLDFPAAIFRGRRADDHRTDVGAGPVIHGRTFALLTSSLARCLDVIDEVEHSVEGVYRRVSVITGRGVSAWAYEFGGGFELTPIPSGDWFNR